MPDRPSLTGLQLELLGDIHHQAAEIGRYAVLCLTSDRVGQEWLLQAKHNLDRLERQLERLKNTKRE